MMVLNHYTMNLCQHAMSKAPMKVGTGQQQDGVSLPILKHLGLDDMIASHMTPEQSGRIAAGMHVCSCVHSPPHLN